MAFSVGKVAELDSYFQYWRRVSRPWRSPQKLHSFSSFFVVPWRRPLQGAGFFHFWDFQEFLGIGTGGKKADYFWAELESYTFVRLLELNIFMATDGP